MGRIYTSNKYALPRKVPWVMKQTWNDILLLHYPVKKERLEIYLPPNLSLDTFQGTGWMTIVPYLMKSAGIRGLPSIPMGKGMPGINVRTYVKAGEKPGIYFLNLGIHQRFAAKLAKELFHLPYFSADLSFSKKGKMIEVESRKFPFSLSCQIRVQTSSFVMEKGSLGEWLLERYCFYTANPKGKLLRCDIFHDPWLLQDAEIIGLENHILRTFNIKPESSLPILHYSRQLHVHLWPPVSVK
ncbi:DUF2071 domain-containing protein [Ureibacillus sp. FSL K6-8385]|uniref:DUF2071 domain-containing protein n=1 Tax=Ureibacillus terrenus TaxID=118246 RepID=A0A540V1P3_9BACL|nr:DUF2071 domain-containing protein [Ureibacillus terrenus]MED3662044.1 DUF2071 domain-containing protein [Ureibacillus terrenus]MED3764677.1 DUF2071 domain-containing protein [Ureibacillus terrenus]TQE90669.1 DUF2071 domain-containing protein [Ureibacillus terrenus]